MPRIEQVSFSGGEISPALYGRTDVSKYSSSVSFMRNWFVHVHGGTSTRAGFEFIGYASDVDLKPARLIPFQFNTEQNYILAFGDQQLRIIFNSGFVVEEEQAIVSVTKANPAVVEITGHGFVSGDEVYFDDMVGMTELNERLLKISNVTPNTFELADVDSTNYGTFTAGTGARLYQIATPYLAEDLDKLKFTQSADVMILTHPKYKPHELTRNRGEPNSVWEIKEIEFGSVLRPPVLATPTNVGTLSGAAKKDYGYVVTTVDVGGSESTQSNPVEINTDALSTTGGVRLTWNGVQSITQANPAVITMAGHPYVDGDPVRFDVKGMVELNGNTYLAKKLTANTFSITDQNGNDINSSGFGAFTSGFCNYAKAAFYNVYKLNSFASRIYGYVGQSESNEFQDFNLGPDMSVVPPTNNNPFLLADETPPENNAICTIYHQQRLWFGGVQRSPQTIFASKSGDFKNFDLSNPVRSDDSIEVTLATRQVNEVRHLVSIGPLIALTSGGVWRIDGDSDGVITPTTISTKSQGARGCSNVEPLVVGDTVLFIQALSGKIRDLAYEFESDKYTGNDLTIYAEHLFYGFQIIDWCYAEEPYSMVWCVRSDGRLLSLAYLKEQGVWGWSQHDTDGFFESVASISEGNEDVVYAVVRRTIGGVTRRFIERLHERQFNDIKNAFCVDSGLTYNGPETKRIIGLEHLEGKTVKALADGQVIEELEVSNGEIELPYNASTVHVGLGYTCQIQTLEISIDSDDTLRTRKVAIPRIGMLVRDTRGLAVGASPAKLYEIKERQASFDYGAIPSFTGEQIFQADVDWTADGGKFWVEQKYPLPATILSLTPELTTQ